MGKYTDYCTCFFDPDKNEVVFYDEIKGKNIGKQKVNDKQEADNIMRIWQDNAPSNVICHILNKYLERN